jgi:hypothetical protein
MLQLPVAFSKYILNIQTEYILNIIVFKTSFLFFYSFYFRKFLQHAHFILLFTLGSGRKRYPRIKDRLKLILKC